MYITVVGLTRVVHVNTVVALNKEGGAGNSMVDLNDFVKFASP